MSADCKHDIYSEIKGKLKCRRLYAFAVDLEKRCESCGDKVGDHMTPLALRGVVKMIEASQGSALIGASVVPREEKN